MSENPEMAALHAAKKKATQELIRSMGGDLTPREADTDLNDAQRALIAAMAKAHGEVWLGEINRSAKDRVKPVMTKWDGGLVYNFGADFAVPAHDPELERMILERETAPYTGTAGDRPRVIAIMARIDEIGGVHLTWS